MSKASIKDEGVLNLFMNRSLIHNSILNSINKKQKRLIREQRVKISRPETRLRDVQPIVHAFTPKVISKQASRDIAESDAQTFNSPHHDLFLRTEIDHRNNPSTVSYTHLTLPTKRIV